MDSEEFGTVVAAASSPDIPAVVLPFDAFRLGGGTKDSAWP